MTPPGPSHRQMNNAYLSQNPPGASLDRQLISVLEPLLDPPQTDRWTTYTSHMGLGEGSERIQKGVSEGVRDSGWGSKKVGFRGLEGNLGLGRGLGGSRGSWGSWGVLGVQKGSDSCGGALGVLEECWELRRGLGIWKGLGLWEGGLGVWEESYAIWEECLV